MILTEYCIVGMLLTCPIDLYAVQWYGQTAAGDLLMVASSKPRQLSIHVQNDT